jgi:mRNA-degrading endonuclease RelE of RelBE toxin-antitoxin system
MNHLTLPRFWQSYNRLPKDIQVLADKKYELLKNNPFHPSLHFKKVGNRKQLWSVRINDNYRALGIEKAEGIVWFWIGMHSEYDEILYR